MSIEIAKELLHELLEKTGRHLQDAPKDRRGIYGLVDHDGRLSYIGSTSSPKETLYKRIHNRHRTGSEDKSHYFARMYNTGRMWRDRVAQLTHPDAAVAKRLRNEFILDHCRAVWCTIDDHEDIAGIEKAILEIAPNHVKAWNNRASLPFDEPEALVDQTIRRLQFSKNEIEALERQRRLFEQTGLVSTDHFIVTGENNLPRGPFRFIALDVETANNDRASICQVGLAGVRPDNTIASWSTYVDPQTDNWSCSWVHGITAEKVEGAPRFPEVLSALRIIVGTSIVIQHSSFDKSAISAACSFHSEQMPHWIWSDSVRIARSAWPDLKGNGGHGLANLKTHLGLDFNHHDARDDARAAAQIVLRAEEQCGVSFEALAEGAVYGPSNERELKGQINIMEPAKTRNPKSETQSTKLSRMDLKKQILRSLDAMAREHHKGHQTSKVARYVVEAQSGQTFEVMFEKNAEVPANLWVLAEPVKALWESSIKCRLNLASELNRRHPDTGKIIYGRHSALGSMEQLKASDLACFELTKISEFEMILKTSKAL